ncbi:SBBP repeat-containing protein [Actibacterium sp. D379-3]
MAGFSRIVARLSVLVATIALGGASSASEMKTFSSGGRPVVAWAMPVGEVDAQPDEIDGISVDPSGNTIISGVFRNKLTLGGTQMRSRGAGDIFMASISPEGKFRWVRQIGGPGDDNTFDLTTDASGNIYASGWYSQQVDFGGVTLKSAGKTDQFVTKISPSGKTVWAKSFGGRGGDGGNEISVLPGGDIAVSGITEGDFTVDGKTYKYGGGKRDAFVIRMAADGKVLWVRHVDGPGTERIRAMSMGPTGDVYVGFQYHGTLRFGSHKLESKGEWDGAAARLTPDGEIAWVVPVGSAGTDNVRGIGVGSDGSVYASGVVSGKAVMIDRTIPQLGRKGDDYLARLSPEGKLLWLVTMSGPGTSVGGELTTDARGVLVSAMLDGPVTIRRNKDKVTVVEPPTGRPTSYVAAFDRNGGLRFIYTPSPDGPGGGAFGDVLSVSRNGNYLAQAIRFRQKLNIAGKTITTPSKKDSAVIFLRLNGS